VRGCRGKGAPAAHAAATGSGIQDGGHLRAEFAAATPYYYSTYEEENEARPSRRRKVIILGGGPNRIGQGIEFDYCCVHGVFALKEEGFEVQMINCNPETVSTDYDITDRLFFEPLTLEDVMRVIDNERPYGVIVQFGGQTPLKLAIPLERAGVRVLGTSPDSIDLAEDRKRFGALLRAWASLTRPTARPDRQPRRCRSPGRSAIRSWCGLPTSWAAGR